MTSFRCRCCFWRPVSRGFERVAASVYGAEEEDASDFEEEVQAATWARERSRWRSYIIEVLYDRYIGIYISIIYIIYIYILLLYY